MNNVSPVTGWLSEPGKLAKKIQDKKSFHLETNFFCVFITHFRARLHKTYYITLSNNRLRFQMHPNIKLKL